MAGSRVDTGGVVGRIVGREPELAAVRRFIESGGEPHVLVITGEPGIGKTTVWEAGIELGGRGGFRVLAARPSDTEVELSFAGIADLLEGIEIASLEGVPGPQARAIDAALLRAEPEQEPPASLAIATGFMNALRALASREPLLVAVDDVQWLDRPSAEALSFAARRLRGQHAVRLLLTRRSGGQTIVERALDPSALARLEVGPISLGATRALLTRRLGLTLPRWALRRVFETAAGNPLFALELGRTIAEHGIPGIGWDLPLSDALEDAFGSRVQKLPPPLRQLLLTVALGVDIQLSELAAVTEGQVIEDAVAQELLIVDGERVRAGHPLLAATAKKLSRSEERRALHLRLSQAVRDEMLRALHLALATDAPDAELAATVGTAAAACRARGALHQAVTLAEHALRLTPSECPKHSERLLALAEYLSLAGEHRRVADLLGRELDRLSTGSARARAHLLLSDGGALTPLDQDIHHLECALAESGADDELRAIAMARKAVFTAVARRERVHEAEEWVLAVLPAVEGTGSDAEREVLHALCWTRVLRGLSVDDLVEGADALSDVRLGGYRSLSRIAAVRLTSRGELDKARDVFVRLLALADEAGDAWSYTVVANHLCAVALRAGKWDEAASLLDERSDSALGGPSLLRNRALLAAGRGLPEEAEDWAQQAIAAGRAIGVQWDALEALRARGIAALLGRDPERAAESFGTVWEHLTRAGIEEPGDSPVAPELVEALVELDEIDKARAVTERLASLALEQDHPWGLASAARCRGLIGLSTVRYEDAARELSTAAAQYAELGFVFDQARTLLALGRGERRLKKWGAARRSLEQAIALFDELGSPGWTELARSERSRVGARAPSPPGRLTPAEARVAELAAGGLSNKEIAGELFVTVNTVEVHLKHAYAKLGIRSRGQLAGRLDASA